MRLTGRRDEIQGLRRLTVVLATAALGVATCASAVALNLRVASAPAAAAGLGAAAPKKIMVSSGVMAGNSLTKVNPKYPDEAKKAKIQGTIVLSATIGKDGMIEDLHVVSGPKELQQSSLDAVKQWTYKPYLLNGEPVEVETQINVTYSLSK